MAVGCNVNVRYIIVCLITGEAFLEGCALWVEGHG
jgi:hypothetical protein